MDMNQLIAQQHTVLWASFFVAAFFGFVTQRSHFCTMGAISDIVNMGSWSRMRMWALAVGVAVLGFYGLVLMGWVDPKMTIYAGTRIIWLSALLGGALFGLGMVLASGCGSKTLVRIGAGSLKALVVFFVMAVAAYAALRGVVAVLRVNTSDTVAFELAAGSSVPQWLEAAGVSPTTAALVAALVVGGGLVAWALSDADARSSAGIWGGLGVGLSVVLMWAISGYVGFVPEHPETLESVYLATNSGRIEALTFTAPMAYTLDWVMLFSDTSKKLTLGIVAVFGVVVGAFVAALWDKSFRWEGFSSTQDTALHLVGAALMGVGGVTAMGCTVGQGLSGLSTLSLVSMIAVVGIVLGSLVGFRVQLWLLERE
jgi:uncharacterized membrane protein YedE/YeeE